MAVSENGFTITRMRSGGTVRVSVSGELDIATTPRLRAQFEREKQEDVEAALLVDLREVTFMDSSGVHTLVWACEELGGRLGIMLSNAAARVVEMAGLREELPIIDG